MSQPPPRFPKTVWLVLILIVAVGVGVLTVVLLRRSDETPPPAAAPTDIASTPVPQSPSETPAPSEVPEPPAPCFDLGLLAPVTTPDGAQPSREQLLQRYQQIVHSFLPDAAQVQPEVRKVVSERNLGLEFQGPVSVCFLGDPGQIQSFEYTELAVTLPHTTVFTKAARLDEPQRSLIDAALQKTLREKLGVCFNGEVRMALGSGADDEEGRRICYVAWNRIYHGYPHLDQTFTVKFEWRDDQPRIIAIQPFGRMTVPDEPVINVPAEQAAETALAALKKWNTEYSTSKSVQFHVSKSLGYAYRTHGYDFPYRTRFCHVIDIYADYTLNGGPWKSSTRRIYVDADNGSVIGDRTISSDHYPLDK